MMLQLSLSRSNCRETGDFAAPVTTSNLHKDALETDNDGTLGDKENKDLCTEPTRKKRPRWSDSTSSSRNKFVTLRVTHSDFKKGRVHLPLHFMRENRLNKHGSITLVGKDGGKMPVNVRCDTGERMSIGRGWKSFSKANDLKSGESYTFELTWEDDTPLLSLVSTESSSDRSQQGECVSTEPSSGNKTSEVTENGENSQSREEPKRNKCLPSRKHSPSPIPNLSVILTLTAEDVSAGILHLPNQFMKDVGINKLGEMKILGKNNTKCFGYLLSKGGFVALGTCWKEFCERNDLKLGDSFTLKFLYEQDQTPVMKLCSIN